jgi:hypothetical protein
VLRSSRVVQRPHSLWRFVAAFVVVGAISHARAIGWLQENPDPTRFAKEIEAFEAKDRASPPSPGAPVFVGSSSIHYWNLAKAFPTLHAINRGFGGSHVSDTIFYADRIIFRYQPRLIVFYAGDADVAAQKSADRIFADCKTLLGMIHKKLPRTRTVIIGIKPSPAHWEQIGVIRQSNALVQKYVATDPLVSYADVERSLLGQDGKPQPGFFGANGLNLNEAGYEAWTAAVGPAITKALATK